MGITAIERPDDLVVGRAGVEAGLDGAHVRGRCGIHGDQRRDPEQGVGAWLDAGERRVGVLLAEQRVDIAIVAQRELPKRELVFIH